MKFGHFDDQNKEYVITSTKDSVTDGSTTSDVRISFLWYQIPAVATASIRMQSFCVSPDTATTTCHTTATDTTTI